MKYRYFRILALLVVLGGGTLLASGCMVHTLPPDAVMAQSAVPAHIYYQGRDLYYRSNGYYYYDDGYWRSAPAVPTYYYGTRYYGPSYYRSRYYGPSYYRSRYYGTHYYGTHRRYPSRTYRTYRSTTPSYRRTTTTRPSRPHRSTPSHRSGPTHVTRPSGGSRSSSPRSSGGGPRRVTRH